MKIPPLVLLVGAGAVVVMMWVGYGLMIACNFGGINNAGLFGDMFGGFSALMSALGFAAVVTTLYVQNQQLDEERRTREAADTRQEKQLGIMQAQLTLLARDAKESRERYESSLDPKFVFAPYDINSRSTRYELSTTGNSIARLRLIDASPLVELNNAHLVESGQHANLRVTYAGPEKIVFTFEYVTVANGNVRHQRFVVEEGRSPRRAMDEE